MNLLLHCCCAPCSVACVKSLDEENIKPALFWYNPNIHPYTEYKSRRDCLTQFAGSENLHLTLEDVYDIRFFIAEIFPQAENRCQKCYALRLEKTASFAVREGYSAFTTTLLISPYQDHGAIKDAGEEAASRHGIEFFYRDFRPLFREGQAQARSKSMYMQKYCGCIFSEEERYLKNLSPKYKDTQSLN